MADLIRAARRPPSPPGRSRGSRDPVLLGALALIAASLALRVVVLTDSFFVEDDFLFVADAYENGLSLDYLTHVHKGHLMPGALALAWVLARIAPYDWVLVSAVTLAVQLAASLALLRFLRTAFGVRPGILPPLALFLFSPLTIPPFAWWAASLNAVPLQLALAMALTCHLRHLRGHGGTAGAALWSLAGMAFSTKGVFIPPLLFLLTTAYLGPHARGGWLSAIAAELRERLAVWSAHATLVAGWAVLYLARRSTAPGEGVVTPDAGVALDLAGLMLGRTFPAGAVGGPVTWTRGASTGGLTDPGLPLLTAAWLALAALVVATCWFRRHGWRAWAVLGGYLVLADAVPTILARGSFLAQVGLEARYVADGVLLYALCLALAALPLRGEAEPYRRPPPGGVAVPLVAGAACAVFLAVSLLSVVNYRATLTGDRVRAYLAQVRASLAAVPSDAEIYPVPLPDEIALPWNGERRLSGRTLSPLAGPALRERMRDPRPSHHALVFDGAGRLVKMSVFGFYQRPARGARCFAAPMSFAVTSFGGPGVAGALNYSAERPGTVLAELGGRQVTLKLRAGADELVHFPMPGIGTELRITVDDPSSGICVRGVALGTPRAEGAPAGSAAVPASPGSGG